MVPTLPSWVRQYLQFMDLAPEPPSVGFLGRLLYAHLHRVPFENISKLYYYPRLAALGWKVPPPEVWTEFIATRDFGGTCFTINGTLQRVLTHLGYDARFMRASGGGHLTVGVKLAGTLYLVDPGLGAPLFEPVDLSAPFAMERFGRGIRVYAMDGEPGAYHLDHYLEGERKLAWTFAAMSEPWEHFTANIDYSYSPTGYFMVFMSCSLYQEHPKRGLFLRNNLFTIREPDGSKSVTELRSVAELEAVLHEEFRRPGLPVREAVQTLTALGVDPFGKI